MNRNFPPPPPGYRPRPPQGPGPQPQPQRRSQPESPYAPVAVLMGLIKQSENRYVVYRDLAMKQDRGFGQLQIDAQNLSIALSPHDPEAYDRIQMYLDAALGAAEHNKRLLEEAMQYEILLQGELKRWLSGQPPSQFAPQVNPAGRIPYAQEWTQGGGAPQQMQGQVPQQMQGQAPPQPPQPQPGQPSQGQPQQQPQPGQQPQYFKGQYQQSFAPGDLRDPKQAQEFLRRAEQMPIGNAMGQSPAPGQPVYQTPNQSGGYAQPPGVPVSMHYADPQTQQAQQQPVHFPSAESAAAAVAQSHSTNTPIQAPPQPAAQNGAAHAK